MASGISAFLANKCLEAGFKATSFSVTTVYVKLHTGAPGSAGTSNPATETSRKAATFAAASGGVIASNAAVQWTGISGSQDATDFSLWDDPTAGNFLGSGSITANAYTAGDTYTCPSGSLTLSLTLAS